MIMTDSMLFVGKSRRMNLQYLEKLTTVGLKALLASKFKKTQG
jgi:hypothetical protein